MKEYKIEEQAGNRIDKVIANLENEISRVAVQRMIDEGNILVNGKKVRTSYKVILGDVITIEKEEPKEIDILPQEMPLNIIYEDKDIIVLNKPQGVVVHPAPGNYSGTLVNGLLYHCNDLSGINGVIRPGIVHRIDKDTSGILVIAKNDDAHNALAEQFKEHSIKREYYAYCL